MTMNSEIAVAIIAAAASILVAAITSFINRYLDRKREWQKTKLEHYRSLFGALSDLAIDGSDKSRANADLSRAVNTMALVASQEVISRMMQFHSHVRWSNQEQSAQEHDRLLRGLVLAVRKDIGLSKRDDGASFDFHLIGSAPPRSRSEN